MSYYKQVVTTTDGTGESVIAAIKSVLANADSGWSTADGGTTYTVTSGGVTLSVGFPFTTIQSGGKLGLILNGQNVTILTGHTSLASAPYLLEVSAAPDFFYIRGSGPHAGQVGAADASTGSPTSFAMLTTIVPYFTSDTVADDRIVVIASHYTDTAGTPTYNAAGSPPCTMNHIVKVKKGLDGATWANAELVTMRPAVQDVVSVGDLQPNKQAGGGIMYWPFVVVETVGGIRGRLKNVFFGGEAYLSSGELSSQLHDTPIVTVDGKFYSTTQPGYHPTTTGFLGYTPFGVCYNVTTTAGGAFGSALTGPAGPNIIIKRGSGLT